MKYLMPPEKVYEDELVEFFLHFDDEDNLWVHHKQKKKLTKETAIRIKETFSEFAAATMAYFDKEHMYTTVPTKKDAKWLEFNGFDVVEANNVFVGRL